MMLGPSIIERNQKDRLAAICPNPVRYFAIAAPFCFLRMIAGRSAIASGFMHSKTRPEPVPGITGYSIKIIADARDLGCRRPDAHEQVAWYTASYRGRSKPLKTLRFGESRENHPLSARTALSASGA